MKAGYATLTAMFVGLVPLVTTGSAHAATVSFTQLSDLTGGSPASTAVFRADLSGLSGAQIASVTIRDNSTRSAGSPGQFSGFDLDAIVLSNILITSASQVGSLSRAGTFNFASSIFSPGTQTSPADPALFGTSNGSVNNAVATLDSFDGNSTTAIPGAFGFVSLGLGGTLGLNLDSAVTLGGPLFLYIGEVGNNGEVAASSITVSSNPVSTVPLPGSAPLFGAALLALGAAGYSIKRHSRSLTD